MSPRVRRPTVARLWGPLSGDAWPPEIDTRTYPAYLMMRAWLRQHAGILLTAGGSR